jgi:hypothetical protein
MDAVKRAMRRSEWLSPGQLAHRTGYSAKFIRAEIAAGEIKAEKWQSARSSIGRWRIRLEDAEAYIARMVERSTCNRNGEQAPQPHQ